MLLSKTIHMLVLVLTAMLSLARAQAVQSSTIDESLSHARSIYSQQGPKAALPEYERVLAEYRSANDRRGEAITLGLIGNCYKRLGDYPKALSFLNSALEIKREIHDRPEEGRTLSHLGLVFWEQGDYPKAIERFNDAIAIARELKDIQLEASALNNLSLVYDEQGDYPRSLQQYQRALELHRSVKYEPGESDTLGNIGGVYLLLGRYSEAATYYRQALAISERLGLKPSQTQDLGNLASCELGVGDTKDALAAFDRAIVIAHDAGLVKEEADWHRARASALLRLGKFNEALQDYGKAQQTYSNGGLKRELVEVFGDLGNAYLALGDRATAEKYFRDAANVARGIGNKRGVVSSQLAIAEIEWSAGEFIRAERETHQALVGAKELDDAPDVSGALLLLGKTYRDQQRLELAIQNTEDARAIAENRGLVIQDGDALDQLGELRVIAKEFTAAMRHLDKAKEIAVTASDVDLEWRSEYHRAQALEGLNRDQEAVDAYEAAVTVIETVRGEIQEQRFRTGYLQEKQKVYIALVRLLLKLRKPAEAFGFSERLREYSYVYQLHNSRVDGQDSHSAELQSRIRHLQDLMDSEKSRPAGEQRAPALQTYSNELVEAEKEFGKLYDAGNPTQPDQSKRRVDIAGLRSKIAPNAALIEYVVDRRQVSIFVVTRRDLHATTIKIRESDLRAKVELVRGLIRSDTTDAWQQPAASLREILITPLERNSWLSGIDSLLLVPHGVLHYLPFSLLAQSTPSGTQVLIERYLLSELPMAMSLLAEPVKHRGGDLRLVAFAPSSARLQFAIPEAEGVANSFGAHSTSVVGPKATETKFKAIASHYDVIHLATHGYFNRVNPLFSGLQLEADAVNDGRLEVHEIARLHLNARLVTLSACDTGLGSGDFAEIPAGDEFVGLNRAFLEAGSSAVVATLWEVNDRSTLLMMQRLYGAIANHGGVAALASAQREMITDSRYRHPYYWASFIYIGIDFDLSRSLAEKR
jgi:CHAT domain-containing protein/Tfp pilus assembly protein PilF